MADAAHDTLFHRPRIRAAAEQLQVVVRLDHQHMAAAHVIAHAGRHVSQIGADADLDALTAEGEADGIDGIVSNGERHYRDVADLEGAAGGEELETFEVDAIA